MKIKDGLWKYQDRNKVFMKTILANSDITYNLDPDIIEELSYGMKPMYLEQGSFLFKEGDYTSKIFFIISGHISVTLRTQGEEAEVEDLYRGCSLGTYCALMGEPQSINA